MEIEQRQNGREKWENGKEFLMSCIAMSVGLGNIWRFPFIANRNGGGAFLIPYLIVLTLIGRPMYYMEMILGQFSSRGTVKMYEKLSPVFKGIGYAQVVCAFCASSYYCSIIAVTLFYFINSFTTNFPWSHCKDSWLNYTKTMNLTCIDSQTNVSLVTTNTISSAELYYKRDVLKEIDDITERIGMPDWRLTLLLMVSWILTFLISVKGVKSSGKVSYFLALFPYVILVTLFIKAATLEGSTDGMLYFIDTEWNRLLEPEVWYEAVTQCFFSLGVGFGAIIMLSSYNDFSHNVSRDALIISTLDTCTSLLSGITIFGILGNLAFEMKVDPREVISTGGGTGLAFVSYPDVISKFQAVPWLFGILFFLMLFVLGVGTLSAFQGVLNTVIRDVFPNISHWKVSAFTASLLFLVGLLYVTPGGQYVLNIVDHFGGTVAVFLFAILEIMAINWLYGVDQFCIDVEFMTKRKVGIYLRLCWRIIIPVFLTIIFIYFLIKLKPLRYGIFNLEYPLRLTVFGWSIVGILIIQAIIWITYYLWIHRGYPIKQIVQETFSTKTWKPEGQQRTQEWLKFKENVVSTRRLKKHTWLARKINKLLGK